MAVRREVNRSRIKVRVKVWRLEGGYEMLGWVFLSIEEIS